MRTTDRGGAEKGCNRATQRARRFRLAPKGVTDKIPRKAHARIDYLGLLAKEWLLKN